MSRPPTIRMRSGLSGGGRRGPPLGPFAGPFAGLCRAAARAAERAGRGRARRRGSRRPCRARSPCWPVEACARAARSSRARARLVGRGGSSGRADALAACPRSPAAARLQRDRSGARAARRRGSLRVGGRSSDAPRGLNSDRGARSPGSRRLGRGRGASRAVASRARPRLEIGRGGRSPPARSKRRLGGAPVAGILARADALRSARRAAWIRTAAAALAPRRRACLRGSKAPARREPFAASRAPRPFGALGPAARFGRGPLGEFCRRSAVTRSTATVRPFRSWVALRSIRLRGAAASLPSAAISARSAETCLRRSSGVEGAGGTLRRGASPRSRACCLLLVAARAAPSGSALAARRLRAARSSRRRSSGAALPARRRARSISGASKSTPASLRELRAQLVAQHPGAHFRHLALGEIAEFERAEGDADEAIDRKPQMLEHLLDLAVLALAQAHGDPGVGALLAVELRLDRRRSRRRRG